MEQEKIKFLRYPGGKQRLLNHLMSHLLSRESIKSRFVEPFVGGGAVFFALNPKRALLSDINLELIDLYRGIRLYPLEVWEIFESFPSTKKGYYKIRNSTESDLLTVNCLKSYPKWEAFKPLIVNNLEIYQEVAKPKGFKRIGLRYINKIEFGRGPIELTDYFNYYPFIPTTLPQTHETFQVTIDIPYEEGRDHLLLSFASMIPEKPDVLSLLLDLDYIMAIPERIPLDQASNWIEKAHTTVENAFEACITDKCRSLFGEEK